MKKPFTARDRFFWLSLAGTSLGVTALLLFISTLWDLVLSSPGRSFFEVIFSANLETARYLVTSVAQCLASTLGISFMVVALIVQLTADRYSAKVIDLFVKDRLTRAVLSLFVISIVYSLWLTHCLQTFFIPTIGILFSLVLMSMCFGALLPYFYYVFELLKPSSLILNIKTTAISFFDRQKTSGHNLNYSKEETIKKLEELSDIAMTSTEKMDTEVSLQAVEALEQVLLTYLKKRKDLPAAWFESVQEKIPVSGKVEGVLSRERLWLEVKGLRQMTFIFGAATNRIKDVTSAVAASTRSLGQAALAEKDMDLLTVIIKFFNTYLRHAINHRDNSSLYNVLYQYRLFAETVLDQEPEKALSIASYFKYYGQIAENLGIIYIQDTVAHDLKNLCEQATTKHSPLQDKILSVFLSLYEIPLAKNQNSLKGIVKNYLALAAFYKENKIVVSYPAILATLKKVPSALLQTSVEEIKQVQEQEFWEVTDRVINFDYLEPSLRRHLDNIMGEVHKA